MLSHGNAQLNHILQKGAVSSHFSVDNSSIRSSTAIDLNLFIYRIGSINTMNLDFSQSSFTSN